MSLHNVGNESGMGWSRRIEKVERTEKFIVILYGKVLIPHNIYCCQYCTVQVSVYTIL